MEANSTRPHWIAIFILSAAIIGIGIKFIVLGSTSKGEDGRTAIHLSGSERDLVLGEMRQFVVAIREINAALASGNMAQLKEASIPVGSAAMGAMSVELKSKLPIEFKKLGFGLHYAFDDIGKMADEKQPAKAIQMKLAESMDRCIACHEGYQLPAPLPSAQ